MIARRVSHRTARTHNPCDKVRVGFYCWGARGLTRPGGPTTWLVNLVEGLDPNRFEAFLLDGADLSCQRIAVAGGSVVPASPDPVTTTPNASAQDAPGSLPREALREMYRALTGPSIKLTLGELGRLRRIRRFFRSLPPFDIIHCVENECDPAAMAARLSGAPIVVGHYHCLPDVTRSGVQEVRRVFERLGARSVDRAILVSNASARIWQQRLNCPGHHFRVVHNGLNPARFSGDGRGLRHELGIPPGSAVIGLTANFNPVKGHVFLVQAAQRVLAEFPEARFVLVGDGPLKGEIETMVQRRNLNHAFHFLGRRDDVPQITSGYDIAVLSSISESLPLAVIESMFSAKPVVVTDCGGVTELVQEGVTGHVVPPRDPAALARGILQLLKDPEGARRMGQAGRERALNSFTCREMAAKTAMVYEELLAHAGSSGGRTH